MEPPGLEPGFLACRASTLPLCYDPQTIGTPARIRTEKQSASKAEACIHQDEGMFPRRPQQESNLH